MLTTILTFIATYWLEILIGLICASIIGIKTYKFSKLPVEQKFSRIRAWLIFAVTEAEKEWGGGTGQIKLAKVYDAFCAKYPIIKIFISMSVFSQLVDSALEEMKKVLERKELIELEATKTETPTTIETPKSEHMED